MKVSSALALFSSAALVAQSNATLCDTYTTALFKNNTGANQLSLLTALVNSVVIGNYTPVVPGASAYPGILANGTVQGQNVSLLQYFDGSLYSTNNRSNVPASVNFLDDGGAAPLKMNMPAMGTTSHQYNLLTHLYQYFGALLGCTQSGFPKYAGDNNLYEVHKFMDLNAYEIGYFIEQVGLAALGFGVSLQDATTVGTLLNNTFNQRCSPASNPIGLGSALQAMCINSACPVVTSGAVCTSYNKAHSGEGVRASPVPADLIGLGVPMTLTVTTTSVNGSSTMLSTYTTTEGQGGAMISFTTGTTTIMSGTMNTTSTFTSPITILMTTETTTNGSSTITTTFPVTEAVSTSLGTTVITSGGSTITSTIMSVMSSGVPVGSSAGGSGAAATTTSKSTGADIRVSVALLIIAGIIAVGMI